MVNFWWTKKVGLEWLQLTDLRHQWGIRSIYAEIDPRAAAKSMGHSIQVHYSTYNSTYGKKDAMAQAKKLKKWGDFKQKKTKKFG